MIQGKLRAEEGARLFCGVKELEPGVFRAWCFARTESDNDDVLEEAPEQTICGCRDEADRWLVKTTVSRGFDRYTPDVS